MRDGEAAGLFYFSFDDRSKPIKNDAEKKLAMKRARAALSVMAKKLPVPDGEVEVTMPYRAYFPA